MTMEEKAPEAGVDGSGEAKIDQAKDRLQDLIDAALYIHEVVKSICSATTSVKDLLNFRLVNKTFHYEATVRMRIVPAYVQFKVDKTMAEFLEFMKSNELKLVSPFTAFKLRLNEPAEVIEEFATVIGPTARHYALRPRSTSGSKHLLAVLLSKSPFICTLHLSRDQFLTAEDLALLPCFSELQVIQIDCSNYLRHKLPDTFSLLSTLVSKASLLKHIRLPPLHDVENPSILDGVPYIEVFRAIAQNHQRLPTVSMNARALSSNFFTIGPDTIHIFEELIQMNFQFEDLSMAVDVAGVDEEIGNKLIQTVSAWLTGQSCSLVRLHLREITSWSLVLPPFPHLTELSIDIFGTETEDKTSDDIHFQPFTHDQFPVLRKLDLTTYCANYFVPFAQTRLPLVEDFSLTFIAGSLTESWNFVLPNLRILRLECSAKDLAVLLTEFTELTELYIKLWEKDDTGEPNYWDIWTGGAPRPLDIKALFNTAIKPGGLDVEDDNNDGRVRVPSLRNMKVLQKFKCTCEVDGDVPKLHLLDPVTYMTLAKHLVPLQELEIVVDLLNIAEETRVEYENILAKFHKHVKISDDFYSNDSGDGEEENEETDYDDEDLDSENMDDEDQLDLDDSEDD